MIRALFVLSLFAAVASAQLHPCAYQDASAYWMRERYVGIDVQRDADGERQWVPNLRTSRCFRTPVADIAQPLARNWGYRRAAEEWLGGLPFEPAQCDGEASRATRAKLAALLGRDFESMAATTAWWQENADYLAWSEKAGRMVVDEQAKRASRPVTTRDAERTITASAYWLYEAKGHLRELVDDGVSVRGIAWTSDHDDLEIRFRVAKTELLDRATKEAAYRRAVDDMTRILAEPGVGPQSVVPLGRALTRVSGRTFADARAWVTWWAAHRNSARLDAQGLRLTTE